MLPRIKLWRHNYTGLCLPFWNSSFLPRIKNVTENSYFNLFPNDKILDSSKLKEFAHDSFKLDENSRKFSKRVENTVGKGEIARYEQFLLFPQCFQETCTADT